MTGSRDGRTPPRSPFTKRSRWFARWVLLPIAVVDVALVAWIALAGHSWYALLPAGGTVAVLWSRWWSLGKARQTDASWERHRQLMAGVLDPRPVPTQREDTR